MATVKKVWVLAEKHSALAQLCAGGRQLGDEVSTLISCTREEAEKAISLGADKVYWLGQPDSEMMFEDYCSTIVELVKKEQPELMIIQASKRGKLIGGKLAAKLETSIMVDASDIAIVDGKIQVTHMVHGGAAFRIEKSLAATAIVTVGSIFSALPEDASRKGAIIDVDFIAPANKIKVLEKKTKGTISVNLDAAKRVVGIGRGFSNQEDLKLAEDLAGVINAEIGCSRPIAEGLNWLPRERYIGVSGVMLKPDIYVAIGISGQVQHMVGANQAKVVIAINKDKAAPIFKQSDYGIVGDLYKILPALVEKLKTNG